MRCLTLAGAALAVAAIGLTAGPASAQSKSEDEAWCWDTGNRFSAQQQIAGCTSLLESKTLSDEDRPYVIAMLGYSLHDLKRYDEALEQYSEKIRLQPEVADGYGWRADVYFDIGEEEKAIADYSKAIALGPKSPDLPAWYRNRGIARNNLGDVKGALKDFDEGLEIDGPDAPLLGSRGDAYLADRKFRDAIKDYSAAIELAPEDSNNWSARCRARAAQGRGLDQALADCDKALSLDPGSSSALESRGLVRLKQKDWNAALEDYDSARANDPTASAWFGRGIALLRLEREDAADKSFSQALKIDADIEKQFAEWNVER